MNNTNKPTKRQLEYQSWEMGLFIHFGIRTFYEGYKDWDLNPMDASKFNPVNLDCEQWIKTAKEAGMEYAVFVAKHHDGFANWPSKYTDYSVAATPWKDGHGDVVREFVDACNKYDMKVGIYYSPADYSQKTDEPVERDYDGYFINQISELLNNYGHIDILWFDGCGSEGHEYDWHRIISEIRTMQPNILIFNMGDPDFRWGGNEAGIAPNPCFNRVSSIDFSINTNEKMEVSESGQVWLPAECDCRMRKKNWFYSDHDEHTVKSLDQLMGIYYYSVGRGANLLLNIGPNREGLLPEADREMLLNFGNEIRRRFDNPILSRKDFTQEGNSLVHVSESTVLVNNITIAENLENGEHIQKFRISIKPDKYGAYVNVYEGYHVGHKNICSFPTIEAVAIRIDVLESEGDYEVKNIEAFYTV